MYTKSEHHQFQKGFFSGVTHIKKLINHREKNVLRLNLFYKHHNVEGNKKFDYILWSMEVYEKKIPISGDIN